MQWTYILSYMSNIMFITFSQQILSDRLLLAVTNGQNIISIVSLSYN